MADRGEFDDEGFVDSLLKRTGGNGGEGGLRPLRVGVFGAIGVIALILVGFIVFSDGEEAGEAPLPVVQAEGGDYKIAPEDRGGMDVPNENSTVFENLKGEKRAAGDVENLLEDGEDPVRKDEVFMETPATPVPDSAEKPEPEKTDIITEIKNDARGEDAAPAAPAPKEEGIKKPMAEQKKTVTPAPKPAPGAGSPSAYIQLGAVKSEAEARAQWPKLQRGDPALSGLSLRVQKAETQKGTFYRIQAGPVDSEAARGVCSALNARKSGSCLVAKP